MSNGQEQQGITEAKWYYQGPDEQVHGPYSSVDMLAWFKYGWFNESFLLKTEHDDRFYTLAEWIRVCGQASSEINSALIMLGVQLPFPLRVFSMDAVVNERINQGQQLQRQNPVMSPFIMSHGMQSPTSASTPAPMPQNGPPMNMPPGAQYVVMNGSMPPPPPYGAPMVPAQPYPNMAYRVEGKPMMPTGGPPPMFYHPTPAPGFVPVNGAMSFIASTDGYQRPMQPPFYAPTDARNQSRIVQHHVHGVLSTENPSTMSNTPESENASQGSEGVLVVDKGVDTGDAPWLIKVDAASDPIHLLQRADLISTDTQTSALEISADDLSNMLSNLLDLPVRAAKLATARGPQ